MAGKSKSLLTKTSAKKKPVTKRRSKTTEYTYESGQVVVYMGNVIEGYSGQEAKVINRSRTYNAESYTIEFSDGEQLKTTLEILRAVGEIEEVETTDTNIEADIPFTEDGKESYHNPRSCLNQTTFAHYDCDHCHFLDRCVFIGKHEYKKYDLH